jgi:glycosyltransferase involved in cell wall biosynthesis
MKVILLAPTPPPFGGIAGWTVRMQNASLKNGWKVEVVDEKLIGNREVFGDKNKRNLRVEMNRSLNIWKQLINALKDKEAKVVHSCIPASTTGMMREYICGILTKVWKKKFIIHYRCTLPNMVESKLGLFMFRLLTDISDSTIVLNSPSVEFVKKYSKTDVILIPNFIEETAIIKENEKIISEKVQRILYVGGVIETKGCYDVIKVAEKFPGVQFRLVGNAEKEIMDMVKPSNVILLGEKNKSEVKQELEEADIFIFVTYFPGEGFSNALAEAMANGLPCIVTDWAANKDMIEGNGGIIVPIKDTGAMINAVNKLIGNKMLREKQSQWNINKVKNCYIDKVVTDMYVDQYEKLMKSN